jgi:hypothetical protein
MRPAWNAGVDVGSPDRDSMEFEDGGAEETRQGRHTPPGDRLPEDVVRAPADLDHDEPTAR